MSENASRGSITISLGWLGFIATGVAQVVAFTFFLARLDGGLSEARADVLRLEAQVNTYAAQVQYLCNERRRDNQEAGRPGTTVC